MMECVRDSLRLRERARETVITLLTESEHEEEEEMMSKGERARRGLGPLHI